MTLRSRSTTSSSSSSETDRGAPAKDEEERDPQDLASEPESSDEDDNEAEDGEIPESSVFFRKLTELEIVSSEEELDDLDLISFMDNHQQQHQCQQRRPRQPRAQSPDCEEFLEGLRQKIESGLLTTCEELDDEVEREAWNLGLRTS